MSDDLPAGWFSARIGDLCEVNPPKASAQVLSADAVVSFVPMAALDAVSATIRDASERAFGEVRKGYTAFADGDVLLAKITPCFENGKAAVARGMRNGLGFGSSEFIVLRTRGAVDPRYLLHFIRQPRFRVDVGQQMSGTAGQERVSIEVLQAVELPLPPLPEQDRIVAKVEALLEDVNRAKARLERVALVMKRFRQAVLAAACTGELTERWRGSNPNALAPSISVSASPGKNGRRGANLSTAGELLIDDEMPSLPDAWRYDRLDRLAAQDTVITYGIVLPGADVPGGVPYVRQQDVADGGIRVADLRRTTQEIAAKHDRSALRRGDILLCIIRNLRVATVPAGLDGANITQGMVRIRVNTDVASPGYIAAYLASPHAQAWMQRRYFGMDMPRINVEDARAVPVALPSIEEQHEIVRRVSALFALADSIEQRVSAGLARAAALPQAILAKAFAGELVPTEAELARAEGRTYETAEALIARIAATPDAPNLGPEKTRGRPRKVAADETPVTATPSVPSAPPSARRGRPPGRSRKGRTELEA